jgi:hypothetical protein
MIPTPDLADLISQTEAHDAKAILASDTGQLQAVENGGAMPLLADSLGYKCSSRPQSGSAPHRNIEATTPGDAELGYAVTGHVAQTRTPHPAPRTPALRSSPAPRTASTPMSP